MTKKEHPHGGVLSLSVKSEERNVKNFGVPQCGTIKIMPPAAAYHNFSLFTFIFSLSKRGRQSVLFCCYSGSLNATASSVKGVSCRSSSLVVSRREKLVITPVDSTKLFTSA